MLEPDVVEKVHLGSLLNPRKETKERVTDAWVLHLWSSKPDFKTS